MVVLGVEGRIARGCGWIDGCGAAGRVPSCGVSPPAFALASLAVAQALFGRPRATRGTDWAGLRWGARLRLGVGATLAGCCGGGSELGLVSLHLHTVALQLGKVVRHRV